MQLFSGVLLKEGGTELSKYLLLFVALLLLVAPASAAVVLKENWTATHPNAQIYQNEETGEYTAVISSQERWMPSGKGYTFGQADLHQYWVDNGKYYVLINVTTGKTSVREVLTGSWSEWTPHIYIDNTTELEIQGLPRLLAVDPISDYYSRNTIEWDYGNNITRRIRMIEDRVQEFYVINGEPFGSVLIQPYVTYSDVPPQAYYIEAEDFTTNRSAFSYNMNTGEKYIQREFFNGVKYPVVTDDSFSNISWSNDGYLESQDAAYATARTSASADSLDTSASTMYCGQVLSGNYIIWRDPVYFNTSALYGATVTKASIQFYITDGSEGNNTNAFNATYGMPGYPRYPPAVADFGLTQYTDNDVGGSPVFDVMAPGVYFNITVWNSKLTYINTSSTTDGITKFLIRTTEDIQNFWGANSYMQLSTTNAGGGKEPKLFVTYTAGAGTPPDANFQMSGDNATFEVASVQLKDTSSNTPTSWLWDFGDGYKSTSQNPFHIYNTTGTFWVNMSATNAGGTDSVNLSNAVTVWDAGELPGYSYRKMVYVRGGASTDKTLDYFQLNLSLWNVTGTDDGGNIYMQYNQTYLNYSDVRFTDTDGNTTLPYWIMESPKKGNRINVYVKLYNLGMSPNVTGFFVYYNNSASLSSLSSMPNTFKFADDFDDGSINGSLWDTHDAGTTESGGTVTVAADTALQHYIVGLGTNWTNYGDGWLQGRVYSTNDASTSYNETFGGSATAGGDTSTQVAARYAYKTTASIYRTYSGGASTSAIGGDAAATWMIQDMIRNGSANFYLSTTDAFTGYSGSNGAQITATYPTSALNPILNAERASANIKLDWILVRKWANTTPVVWAVLDMEENYTAGHPPVEVDASFSCTPTSSTQPKNIVCTDASTGSPISWLWEVDNGTTRITSTNQNPTFPISWADDYSVNMTVSDGDLIDVANKTFYLRLWNANSTMGYNVTPQYFTNDSTTVKMVDNKASPVNMSLSYSFNWSIWSSASTDVNVTYNWNWSHIFPVPTATEYVDYYINHSVTDSYGTNWSNTTWLNTTSALRVYANSTPTIRFTGSPTSGANPLTVNFDSSWIGGIYPNVYCWTYGDGDFGATADPTHIYDAAGTYSVTLDVTNYTLGNDTFKRAGYITVGDPPVASFSCTPTSATQPKTIGCTDSSTNTPTSWLWEVNNGTQRITSTTQNPSIGISFAGDYDVNMTATNAYGSDVANKTFYLRLWNANATIIYNITPQYFANDTTTVALVDKSTGTNITSTSYNFNWSVFSSGSTDVNVTYNRNWSHIFPVSSGSEYIDYYINHSVTDSFGSNWSNITWRNTTSALRVYANSTPTVWFDNGTTPRTGNKPLSVTFAASQIGGIHIDVWNWSFGDGNFSASEDPTFIFNVVGTFSVKLDGFNYTLGNYTMHRVDYVTVNSLAITPPTAAFTCIPRTGTINYDTYCEDESTETPTSYYWELVNTNGTVAQTSTAKNSYLNLTFAGWYNVNMSATNDGGTDWENKTYHILAVNPAPSWSWNMTPDDYGNRTTLVYFVDASTGNNLSSFYYDFTDGDNSASRNTTHQFSDSLFPDEFKYYGTNHSATDSYGTMWNVTTWSNLTPAQFVRIFHNETPTSITTPSATTGTRALPVTWTNERVGHIEQDYWFWQLDLPDGTNTSTDEHPLFIYERAGLYTAIVWAGNYTLGNGSYEHTDAILVYNAAPDAVWTSNPTLPVVLNLSQTIQFTSTSTGTNISAAMSHNWSFGDGNVSYGATPQKVYNITTPIDAPYTINYSVTDSYGTAWALTDWYNITGALWVVNNTVNITLDAAPISGGRPLAITTTLTSDGGRVMYCNYSWGDGNVTNGSTLNPTHTYDYEGTFTLNATCGNDAGWKDSRDAFRTSIKTITVLPSAPTAAFSCSPQSGTIHWDSSCTDSSTGATSYYWSVENGSIPMTSAVKNPIFNFTFAGQYNVNMSATNAGGTDWENKSAYILAYNVAPVNSWTANATIVNLSTAAYFLDESTGTNITAWNWSFSNSDDSNVSSSRNWSHRFPETGYYTVNHSVTDSSITPWNVTSWLNKTEHIHVINNTPTISFTALPTNGIAPLLVAFTYTGDNVMVWNITYGDGHTENGTNPSHTYASAGTYSVNLSAYGDFGYVWFNRSDYITVATAAPVASFSCTPRTGGVPQSVTCTDSSTNTPTSWYWSVENGSVPITSVDQNPVLGVSFAGLYNVNMSATNAGGTDWENKTAYLLFNNTFPVNTWNGNATTVNLSTATYFLDTSTGTNISAWNWSLNNDATDKNVSSSRNWSHRFPKTGWYTVNHSVTDSSGTLWNRTSWNNQTNYIHVVNNTISVTDFTINPLIGVKPLDVTTAVTSAGGPIMYANWSWGDGNVTNGSTLQPSYAYPNIGIYNVNVSFYNDAGVFWLNKSNYVEVTGNLPDAKFTLNADNHSFEVVPVQFLDLSTNTPTSWYWNFNDGYTSTDQNPFHIFNTTGSFNVNMSATNVDGTDWFNISNAVTVYDAGWLPNYQFRKLVYVRGGGATDRTLNYFQYNFTIWNTTGTDSGGNVYLNNNETSAQHYDFAVTTPDGNTSLPFWIMESPARSNRFIAYTRLTNLKIAPNVTAFYVYYNNTKKTSSLSSIVSTFRFADDFNDASLNGSLWDYSGDGISESGGTITIQSADAAQDYILGVGDNFTYYGDAWVQSRVKALNIINGVDEELVGYDAGGSQVAAYYSSGTASIYYVADGVGSGSTNILGDAANTWHIQDMIRNGSTASYYLSNVEPSSGPYGQNGVSITANIPTTGLDLLYYTSGSPARLDIDWVLIRKWANQTPSGWAILPMEQNITATLVPPTADFSGIPVAGTKPLTVVFTDTSAGGGISSWYWLFGDGGWSASEDPTHQYITSGTYNVNHSATNAYGTDWENKTAYITVTNNTPTAGFTYLVNVDGVTVQFIDASTDDGIYVSSTWDFGDTGVSADLNPLHTYALGGTYSVSLTYCNEVGCDVVTSTITVVKPVDWTPSNGTTMPWWDPVTATYLKDWTIDRNASNFSVLAFAGSLTAPFEEKVGNWLYFGLWITMIGVLVIGTRGIIIPFLAALFTTPFITPLVPPEIIPYMYLILAVLGAVVLIRGILGLVMGND